MKKISKLLPHVIFILSIMIATFLILDEFNPAMDFVNNNITKILLISFTFLSLINAIITIVKNNKK